MTCDFLHQSRTGSYYWGDRFSAVSQALENSGFLWFFRPEDGENPEALLQDKQVQKLLTHPDGWKQTKYLTIHRSIPKFDVASDLDLQESLRTLGITDVFDRKKADFSPVEFLSLTEGLCVQCMHIGRYDDEPATIARMDRFAREKGYEIDITPSRHHHEIYLSDARRCDPAKLKTVIRHPIRRK